MTGMAPTQTTSRALAEEAIIVALCKALDKEPHLLSAHYRAWAYMLHTGRPWGDIARFDGEALRRQQIRRALYV